MLLAMPVVPMPVVPMLAVLLACFALVVMKSRKQSGAWAVTGEESKMRGEACVKAAASYPIVLRSYEPAANLDERLRRIFA
jgi:hypothetical protein